MFTPRFPMTFVAAIAVATLAREPARAQSTRQPRAVPVRSTTSGLGFGFAGGLSIPAGDLGGSSDAGFALQLRGEAPLSTARWSVRGDLGYDRFGGRGAVDTYSYTSLTANLVHRNAGDRLYQFGGLGVFNARTAFVAGVDRSSTDLGMQAGIGYDLRSAAPRWFLETGLASAFTSGRSSLWFPVRAGFWF